MGPPALPRISSINPNPVRAGEEVTISGLNFLSAALSPAQAGIEVLLDSRILSPRTSTNSEIVVRIPADVIPGSHPIRVRNGTRESRSIQLRVRIFIVTGAYQTSGPKTTDSCLIDDEPIGTVSNFEVSMTDSLPTLSIRIGTSRLNGSLDGEGNFRGQLDEFDPETGSTSTLSITGSMQTLQDGAAGFTGIIGLSLRGGGLGPCNVTWAVVARRITATPLALSPAGSLKLAARRSVYQ